LHIKAIRYREENGNNLSVTERGQTIRYKEGKRETSYPLERKRSLTKREEEGHRNERRK
jgi:hypothetical protein